MDFFHFSNNSEWFELIALIVALITAVATFLIAIFTYLSARASRQTAKEALQITIVKELLDDYRNPLMRKAMVTVGKWYDDHCHEKNWSETFVNSMREKKLGRQQGELITYDDCRRRFSHYLYRIHEYFKAGVLDINKVKSTASVSAVAFAVFIIEHLEKALNSAYNVEMFKFFDSLYTDDQLMMDYRSFHKCPPVKIRLKTSHRS